MKRLAITATLLIVLILTLTFSVDIAYSQERPLVYVDPPVVTGLSPSQNFMVVVKIANVTGLYGFDIRLQWDPAVLDYVSHTQKTPVETYPDGVLHQPILPLLDEVNSTKGTYALAVASLGGPSFNGSGTFFEITFHVKAIGRCPIEIYRDDVASKTGSIDHDLEHGFFSNYVPTPVDIYIDPDKIIDTELVPCNNFTVDVNIDDAVNLELFEFWLSYNNTILELTNITVNPAFEYPPDIEINETEGNARVSASASPSIDGSLTLANVTFHVIGTGESAIDLHNVTLTDDFEEPIPYGTPGDGYFSNIMKARIFVDPEEIIDPTLVPGSEFSIDIKIEDAIDLYAYSFNLSYDTSILTCLGAIISPLNNETHFTPEIEMVDENGYIYINVTYYPPAEPLTLELPTRIVTIYFQVQSFGCTPLDLHNTKLTDPEGASIAHDVGDGFFCARIADVAVISVEVSPTKVYAGRIVNVTVIAKNLGDFAETFNVTAYYDNTTIETQTIVDAIPNKNNTLIFSWNTTGLVPCSNFTISVEAHPVPYELDLTNNIIVDGWVFIKIIGDVNGDGTVDIFDIVAASDAYSSMEGDPMWNPEADVSPQFGIVDIYDIVTIAYHYGESCWS